MSRAKYDVNAYRAGYGSDTLVTADNRVIKVTSTTTFTLDDAERTLKYSITTTYKNAVISQIGLNNWNNLNDRQKAALVSYAYNAGGGALRTWNIAKAISSNANAQQVAKLIETGPVTIISPRRNSVSFFLFPFCKHWWWPATILLVEQ